MATHIPVICDRCRAEGTAGAAGFADFGDLLDFAPVPRRPRADGWTGELQRAFIAALAVTGTPRRAARAVGKSAFGAEQLRSAKGGEGFDAAWVRALALAGEKGRHRLAAGLGAAIREDEANRPETLPAPAASLPEEAGLSIPGLARCAPDQLAEIELTGEIVGKYMLKLQQERRARLEGRIAEADFYLRQITMLEVALDTVSGHGMALLRDIRLGGHDLLHVAETEMSKQLDEARRRHWETCGDPPRPEFPPRHLLVEHDGFSIEPLEATWGGLPQSHDEQSQAFAEQHARDAAAQVAWEAEARRDHERRRAAAPSMDEEPGSAGQPAAEPTGLTSRDSLP
ncbi:MAG: hypothetical protein QOH47_3102 [Sphingomonadales bacterium]|jgi:hypothetical protein|nr:hypothetical protein [Sphingomonadales bacterium]